MGGQAVADSFDPFTCIRIPENVRFGNLSDPTIQPLHIRMIGSPSFRSELFRDLSDLPIQSPRIQSSSAFHLPVNSRYCTVTVSRLPFTPKTFFNGYIF